MTSVGNGFGSNHIAAIICYKVLAISPKYFVQALPESNNNVVGNKINALACLSQIILQKTAVFVSAINFGLIPAHRFPPTTGQFVLEIMTNK